MTKSNIWSQMRLINYIMQNICGVINEHRVNTIAQNCLEYLKDEGRISSFEINMKDNNILNINIPDMFVLDFDITTNETTIESMGHIEDQEILIDVGIYDKKDDINVLYTGSVCRKFSEDVPEEMGIGTFGLGAMPWPTIELKDEKIYVDGEEQKI